VLHVDDDPSILDLAETFLEREGENFVVESATSAREGLDHLSEAQIGSKVAIDCLVSDYDMPGMNGLEFLETVREEHPDLPFILFTDKGSEEIASEAITAGVTDYLNKGSGTDQYTLLANRIANTASQHRTKHELERQTDLLERTQDIASVGGWELDPIDNELRWTDEVHRIHGVSLDYEPTLEEGIDFYHPEDGPIIEEAIERAIEVGESFDEELRLITANGAQRWVRAQGEPYQVDDETRLLRGVFQDITDRKHTENKLRDEQEFTDTVLDTIDDILYVVDASGSFVRWNDRLTDVTGYTDEEIREMHPTEFFDETDHERIVATMSDAFETGQALLTADIRTQSGESIPHEFKGTRLTDANGEVIGVCGIARDVTERMERQRRYDAIFNQTFQFTGLMEPDGTLIEANETARRFGGVEPEDVIGEYIWDSYWWELSSEAQQRVRDAVSRAANGEFVRYEEEVKSAEGSAIIDFSIKPVTDEEGEIILLIPEGRDITDRAERERRFDAVFNNTSQFMGLLQPDGTIVEINDTALEFSDTDRTEIVGRPFWELPPLQLSEGTVERVKEAVERAADSEFARFEEELGSDDDTRTIDTSITPVTNDDGEIEYLVAEGRDISERKKREQDLTSTRNTFSTLLENIPAGVLAEDASRNVLFANKGFCELFGIDAPPEALIGADCQEAAKGVRELFVDSERFSETNTEYVAEQVTADRETFELVDGRVLERSATPISIDDEENRYLWVYHDITNRKQHEREIERERDRFATLFENIPDPSVTVDLESGEAITRSVNNAFEDVFRYAPETVVGESLNDFIVPSDRMNEATAIDRGAVDGEYMEADVCRRTADDELREFLFRSVPIEQGDNREAFGIYTDITDRREHETYRQRLYEITADTELATDETIQRMLELGCEYLDMESGFLTHIEDDTQRIVRANSPHEALQPGSECPLSEAYCRKTIEMDEPMTVAHAEASGWEGDSAHDRFGLEAYVGARLTVDGERYGTVCFADRTPHETDFSELDRSFVDLVVRGIESTLERHKYETELERQNDQLGEFAGVISHDLRNPLTVADGFLELASETGDDEYFRKIGNAHDRMNAIIEDVLTLTRQGERIAETSRVGLAAVAEDTWENVATANADLVIADDLGEVDADEGRLMQLFENLYRNAIEHASETTTIRVGRYPAGFYIEDDGPGIPEGEREKVFDSGYTTGEEGTGMGLSIVDTIATAHGWGVGIGDGIDGGARFKMQLGMTRGGSSDLLLRE
jgi:PAS domain S-box-containing protein